MDRLKAEVTATAARLVVEEGLEYGPAKLRARKMLGSPRADLPDNDELEAGVREYIDTFHADSQPGELHALRELALQWMDRLADFRPYLAGAVWHGTATRLSDIHLQLFCDDQKAAEIALIDRGVRYQAHETTGLRGEPAYTLSIHADCAPLGETVGVHLAIHETDALRGALKPDAQGRAPRGDARAVRALLGQENSRTVAAP